MKLRGDLNTLEYEKILALLAECAPTDGAKELALRLIPRGEVQQVRFAQRQTEDAKRLMTVKGMPPFGGIRNIGEAIERAEKSAVLTVGELLDVLRVLEASRKVRDYAKSNRSFETELDSAFDSLVEHAQLERKLRASIVAEDRIADEASPNLADIRRKKQPYFLSLQPLQAFL